jgi:hypothetical protein
MIERERAEFGCFSTQISREWHMGHAAKASVGLSSDPRSSSAPRRFQRFMIGGPFSTVLAPFARWGALRWAAGSLARFSKRLQYFFRSLATPRRLPLKRRAVRGLIPSSLPTSPSRTGRETSSDKSRADASVSPVGCVVLFIVISSITLSLRHCYRWLRLDILPWLPCKAHPPPAWSVA